MANKQIKDFDLKESINGEEDLLIQDSDGVTKRIKTSKLMDKPSIPSIDGLATKEELTEGLATKSDATHNHDKVYAPITHEHKQYLTSHQNISGKADKTYVDAELAKKANVSHTHSYEDLTDKPTIPNTANLATKTELTNGLATKANKSEIPSLEGYATETFVTNKIAEASLSGGEVDLSGLATKAELATKADKTAIPTKTSQLTNDSGFLTEHQDLSDYALKTELPTVPTKVSQLANDSGFIKSIPSEYVTETELNAKKYLTAHQDISGKVDKVEGKGLSTNDLTTELKSNYDAAYTHSQSAHFSGSYTDLKNKPTIPKAYVLPQATDSTLGGVKVGAGLKISEGTLSLGSHTHTIANVDGLQAELNKKANTADLKTVATSGSYNDLTNKPKIPTSLPANGGNADTVNNIHIVVLTQEDYDGLEVKDETTLYIIKG